jgi:16S rRNA (adenine(1408)-N(1))-methyltransferase
MQVVSNRSLQQIDGARLRELTAPYAGVALDIGAGDGAWAYRYAAAHADRFVIAFDPVRENMRDWSAKAAKKPAKGGLQNVIFVVAAVEAPPPELAGIADDIFITLPWGSLMRGLILGEERTLAAVAGFGRDGASVRIVLNTRIFDDPVPVDVRDLPEVTPQYVESVLAPRYEAASLRIADTRELDADEVAALGTTWAKRLSHRAPPPSMLITATVAA